MVQNMQKYWPRVNKKKKFQIGFKTSVTKEVRLPKVAFLLQNGGYRRLEKFR